MMNYNRFQGDPAITITKNGASMRFIGGQPVMDQGFHNAVQISLFTKRGWWGNILFDEIPERVGSDFLAQTEKPIIALQTILDFQDAAEKALAWMREANLAKKITVVVINPRTDYIRTGIVIEPPGQDRRELLFVRNGINWIAQAENPANERFI